MPLAPSPAVIRAADVLLALAASPTRSFTVTELARQVGIPRATCNSLLLGLAERGFVRRDAALRYELGQAGIALGEAARVANPALRAAGIHAEALARSESCVVAVTIRDGAQTRVASVYDFGPPFGIRPRAGDAIGLVPPFGATFVAWEDGSQVQAWLQRADPPLTEAESARYHEALAAVRRRGFSITVSPGRQPELATALEHLIGDQDPGDLGRQRDEAIRLVTHSEYLAAELDPRGSIHLRQLSAPVFAPGGNEGTGTVAASVMLLGPSHDLSVREIHALGEMVLAAATRATHDIGGLTR
ncbi:MAG TPA: helix-turn-helix domain-containing protein [Frankiaceae bacterium]|jgi:DNA-binding IclR family transcriptional regulator|nr:helix-turn-helix domain-containing protein [Frankiaceae bacterium]